MATEAPALDILLLDLSSQPELGCDLEDALIGFSRVRRLSARRPEELTSTQPPNGCQALFVTLDPSSERGLEPWLTALHRACPEVPVLAAEAGRSPRHLIHLLEAGVTDFVVPPFCRAELEARIRHLCRLPSDQELTQRLLARIGLKRLVGRSQAFVAALEAVPHLADCDASVMIAGETGTGKEVFARAVHYLSPRRGRPFVAVNCGALPLDLVENELFGHARGAFTGADGERPGLIREAEGGTLFLDEIDALPAQAQVKLLRFLQEREYRRLGSTRLEHADVRLISATNANIESALADGTLRQDLYYRLNVLPLHLPPLRERTEDVPLLATHFLERHARRLGRPVPKLAPGALRALLQHAWPGNVRELEHVMERAVILTRGRAVVGTAQVLLGTRGREPARPLSFREAKQKAVARFERGFLEQLLTAHGGNITHAAKAAQKNRRALFELIRKHGIDAARYRDRAP